MNKSVLPVCLLALLALGCETAEPKSTTSPAQKETPTAEPDASAEPSETTADTANEPAADTGAEQRSDVKVEPLQHGSLLLDWGELTIAVDPTTKALEAHDGEEPKADLVLLTDIHGDHLDPSAVATLRKEAAPVVAPQAVVDEAGDALTNPTVMANGEQKSVLDGAITIEATPMYNLERTRPDTGEPYHVKGRGNGYVLERDGTRIYISGDTECTPEMKALQDIDIALVTMNLPYTMPVEEAAACIREFEPAVVYPFHYRGQDPAKLEELLADMPEVEVRLLEWYPSETK